MSEYSGNELTNLFLDKVLTADDYDKPQINPQDMYYPIWNWEKPNKIRKNGISSEQMDEWIIKILISWGLVHPNLLPEA